VCINETCSLFEVDQEPFSGTIHGNGMKVSGLVLSGGDDEYKGPAYIGLFGYVRGAYIHDLTIELANTADPVVSTGGTDDPVTALYIGALAGFAKNSRLENISVQGPGSGLLVTLSRTNNYVGGAVGEAASTTLSRINARITLNTQENEGVSIHRVGGIVGNLEAGEVSESKMDGDLTVQIGNAGAKFIGGIGNGGTFTKNEAVLGTLSIRSQTEGTIGPSIFVGGIAGSGSQILDCAAQFTTVLDLDSKGPNVGIYVGGLNGNGNIENSHARFEKISVRVDINAGNTPNVFVGGLVGNGTTIRSSYLEGTGSIKVTHEGSVRPTFRVGGLAGNGAVSRSRIGYGIVISLETESGGGAYVGGLTGYGNAEYSFIGTKENPATVAVKKTKTTVNSASYVGGISGQAAVNANTTFQYNYAFCDVSLETTSGVVVSTAGGLVGYLSGAGLGTQNYAAGTVRLINNSTETTGSYYAGGIAGYAGNTTTISYCAALNGEVIIDGTNTAMPKTWSRIANPTSTGRGTTFTSNITTVGTPTGYTPEDGSDTKDGNFKNSIQESDFGAEGLNWDFENTWEWADDFPVLKDEA
jgi:hypothetical protein